jgi:hypothetical protein
MGRPSCLAFMMAPAEFFTRWHSSESSLGIFALCAARLVNITDAATTNRLIMTRHPCFEHELYHSWLSATI